MAFWLFILVTQFHLFWGVPKRKPLELPWLESKMPKNEEDLEASFGQDLVSLATTNKISGNHASQLLKKARKIGLDFQQPWQKEPAKAEEGKDRDKNANRTLKRWMKKQQCWGHLYWHKVLLHNPKTKSLERHTLPFLHPHEWLSDFFLQPGAWEEGMPEEGSHYSQELAKVCTEWGNQPNTMYPLGLHGDGVPVQGKLNQSTLDFFTINMCCSKAFGSMRVPIVCLETKWNSGEQTINEILEIITWSLEHLGKGVYPTARHDGSPFEGQMDKRRKENAGKLMPAKAALLELRGDWDWYGKWYGASQWNTKAGCCWLCSAKPVDWKAMTQEDRRRQSLDKATWLKTVEDRGRQIAPLFNLPGITNKSMKPDWLHVVDEGCGAAAAGQILNEILPACEGNNKHERVGNLWAKIQSLYKASGTPADKRLYKLTMKDIKKDKKPAELDAKAASVRYFCTDVLEKLAKEKCLDQGTTHQKAVYNIARFCGRMYQSLEKFQPQALIKYGSKFQSQFMALESEAVAQDPNDTTTWRVKPKFHLLGHILDSVAEGAHPKDFWVYRNETNGSLMQGLFLKRGGPQNASTQCETVMLRWMSNTSFPSLHDKP